MAERKKTKVEIQDPVEDESSPGSFEEPVDDRTEPAADGPDMTEVGFDEDSPEEDRDVPHKVDLPEVVTITREVNKDYKDMYLRTVADIDNIRKRHEKDRKYAAEGPLSALFPFLDNLERAMASTPEAEKEMALYQGLQMMVKQLNEILEGQGLKRIDASDVAFDYTKHEAVSMMQQEGVKEETVVAVARTGYTFHGRVIRPAQVIVVCPQECDDVPLEATIPSDVADDDATEEAPVGKTDDDITYA